MNPTVLALWLLAGARAAAAPLPVAETDGQALAAEIRSARPTEAVEVQGVMRIRDAQGRRSRIPFHYRTLLGPAQGWRSVYEIDRTNGIPAEKVIVIHADGQPTRYSRQGDAETGGAAAAPMELTGDRAMVPFARSDFWLADLGLEFLHWPVQRLVDDAKVKRRKGRVCRVLESENPTPGALGYTRVVSWVDNETRQPILAEAYDANGRLIKEFEIGGLTKVNGRWELKDMEMRNVLTDSQTILEFRYEARE